DNESDIDIYRIKKAISVHNIVDYVPEDLIERYVMDSDALDYIRLGLAVFAPGRIRTKEGRMIIRTAIELNYIMMLNSIPIEIILKSEV
nr:hypothetical protein [Prevotella sp.]